MLSEVSHIWREKYCVISLESKKGEYREAESRIAVIRDKEVGGTLVKMYTKLQ